MKVIKAKNRGFCYGVKRAIDIADDTLRSGKKNICCIGPIIHNPQVVRDLEKKGLKVIKEIKDIGNCGIIIPSHGISPEIIYELKKRLISIIDATCPYVLTSQRITKLLKDEGYQVIIFGDKNHPEIKGLLGIAKDALVIDKPEELKKFDFKGKLIGLVAQTTRLKKDYSEIVAYFSKLDFKELRVFNTICADTQIRQDCVKNLVKKVDVMLVIGGKNSANTRHLVDIAKSGKLPVYHIESPADLKRSWLKDKSIVGIASGASTPEYIIESVVKKIESNRR